MLSRRSLKTGRSQTISGDRYNIVVIGDKDAGKSNHYFTHFIYPNF